MDDQFYMQIALEEARLAADRAEVPIGAALVDPATGAVVARHGNRTRERKDPTAHAEMLCIRDACGRAAAQRIPGLDLYVTLEPCTMCAAAIGFARIRRLIVGARDAEGRRRLARRAVLRPADLPPSPGIGRDRPAGMRAGPEGFFSATAHCRDPARPATRNRFAQGRIMTLDDAMDAVYASINNNNDDLNAHIAALKAALAAAGQKEAVFDPARLAQGNREGRKMMQSYFRKRGVAVKFAA